MEEGQPCMWWFYGGSNRTDEQVSPPSNLLISHQKINKPGRDHLRYTVLRQRAPREHVKVFRNVDDWPDRLFIHEQQS